MNTRNGDLNCKKKEVKAMPKKKYYYRKGKGGKKIRCKCPKRRR